MQSAGTRSVGRNPNATSSLVGGLPSPQVKDKDFSHIDYVPAALTDYASARSK